eukprot:scaffold247697_cov39-Tisochrysis_lutea.AAC.2
MVEGYPSATARFSMCKYLASFVKFENTHREPERNGTSRLNMLRLTTLRPTHKQLRCHAMADGPHSVWAYGPITHRLPATVDPPPLALIRLCGTRRTSNRELAFTMASSSPYSAREAWIRGETALTEQ